MSKYPLFHFFSSLKLAVVNILLLASVLAVATIMESLFGMRAVYVLIYGTPWFAGVLFLLALNVLCAALSRFPWKKHQTGFVITHLGIITLLAGSWVTQRTGVDGNLPVYEGQTENEVILNDLTVRIADISAKNHMDFPVNEHAWRKEGNLLEIDLGNGTKLVATEFLPRLVTERSWEPSGAKGLGSTAVELELFNSRFRIREWLQLKEADRPTELPLGPATVKLEKFWNQEAENSFLSEKNAKKKAVASIAYIQVQVQGSSYRFPIEEAAKAWQRLGRNGLELKMDKFFPYAVVEKNQLVSKGPELLNPAARILMRDTAGVTEKHTIFANFPEFATLHRKELPDGHKGFGAHLNLVMTNGLAETPAGTGELRFAQSADDKKLYFRSKGKAGDLKNRGEVKVGEPTPTGWMDLEFVVKQWIPNAVETELPRYVDTISGGNSNFLSGLKFQLRSEKSRDNASAGADTLDFWMTEGSTKPISVGGRDYLITYGKEKLLLPFVIFLDKFTMGTNPGTTKAATYQSQVTVIDDIKGLRKPALISMNEPLVHAGYTLYQASYSKEEGRPAMSIFSVNRDWGRWIKYLGSLIIVLGAATMFWMNPHYWGKIFGGGRAATGEKP